MKTDRKDSTSLYVIVSFASNHIIMVLFYDHRGAVWRGSVDIAVEEERKEESAREKYFFFIFYFFIFYFLDIIFRSLLSNYTVL